MLVYWETGSPLFRQIRLGRNKKPFTLYKFRTLYENDLDPLTPGVIQKYLTRTGEILRRTKLDELPQLLNVLQGSMSLVGPRPCLRAHQELIKEREIRSIFSVRPGITGLAQIRNLTMKNPLKLARYESFYIRYITVKLYSCILIQTFLGKGQGDTIKNK